MVAKIANIAKNTSYFTLALVLQKIISFTYFTILARNLIPEDLGKYYFAISFTTIFSIFMDLGTANVLTREVAKDNNKASDWLGSAILIKLPLTALSVVSAIVMINVLGYEDITRNLVYLSVICMVLDSYSAAFFATIRGFHNLLFESISSIIFQLIALILGVLAIKNDLSLAWLMLPLVAASGFMFIYSLFLLVFKWRLFVRLKISYIFVRKIIVISLPFALYGIFQRLYTYLDSVLLSVMAGDQSVGLYQIAFKIIFALQFLPMAFIASLYPALASYWRNNRTQLSVSFERAMNYLIIISLPISIGIIILADKIILIFNDGYGEAVLPLRIIMLSLLFIFINFPIGSLLNACDRQKTNTANMAVALASSIILNIILIPKFQALGASITVLATNALMFALGMRVVPQIIVYSRKKIIYPFFKALIAVGFMAATSLLLKHSLNIFVVIALSGFVYFFVLFVIKGFRKTDIASILSSFTNKDSKENLDEQVSPLKYGS